MGITLGVDTKITMVTDKSRVNLDSFYKSFASTQIILNNPVQLEAGESRTFPITDSKVVILVCDKFGLEQEVLELTFTDGSITLTFKKLGFFMSNISNMTSLTIKNTWTEAVNFNLIY